MLVKDTIREMGFELDDVEFAKEFGNWTLTLFIDRSEGVTIEDCEKVSKAVDPILDEADPISQPYYLSVSSLGLDRPIKKDRDFERNLGKEISVKLYMAKDGQKELEGVLRSFTKDAFVIGSGEDETVILRKDAALVKPLIRF